MNPKPEPLDHAGVEHRVRGNVLLLGQRTAVNQDRGFSGAPAEAAGVRGGLQGKP